MQSIHVSTHPARAGGAAGDQRAGLFAFSTI
jgi:hypothetical protein